MKKPGVKSRKQYRDLYHYEAQVNATIGQAALAMERDIHSLQTLLEGSSVIVGLFRIKRMKEIVGKYKGLKIMEGGTTCS